MVSQLRQRLRGPDPDASRDLGPPQHRGAQVAGELHPRPLRDVGEIEEALVDRVDLDSRREPRVNVVVARRQVAVERVVRRENPHAARPAQRPDAKPRVAHPDAKRLRLGGPRDGAAVVVRQHRHRHGLQSRVEHPLARTVEGVAVDEGVGPAHLRPPGFGLAPPAGTPDRDAARPRRCGFTLATTTPHTSTADPWPSSKPPKSGFANDNRKRPPTTS